MEKEFAFTTVTVFVPLAAVFPRTPLITIESPLVSPWAVDVITIGFAFVAPVIAFEGLFT